MSEQTKNMDEIKLSEGLQVQTNPQDLHNETSSFWTQLCTSTNRNLIPLIRRKSNFIIELISSLVILIVYIVLYLINYYSDNYRYSHKLFSLNSIILNKYFNSSKIRILETNSESKEDIIFGVIILYFTFISYSGFTLSAVVREKEKNIKHLLYLSGNNMYCYWLGFFFVVIIKYFFLFFICFSILCFFFC